MKLSTQPSNRAIFVCLHIFDNVRDAGFVYVDADGDIQITCSGNDHDFSNSREVHIVGLGHLINRDDTLGSIPDLQNGDWAERGTPAEAWKVFRKSKKE